MSPCRCRTISCLPRAISHSQASPAIFSSCLPSRLSSRIRSMTCMTAPSPKRICGSSRTLGRMRNGRKLHDALLIVTWDEGGGLEGNRVATILYGRLVQSGQYAGTLTHYGTLRTLEDMFNLPH